MLLKKYFEKSYTINEFMQLDDKELNLIDKYLESLKNNKLEYARLVFLLALFMNNNSCVYAATNNDMGLSDVAFEIIHMVLIFAKYGCLGKGIVCMTQEMLQGANLKEAFSEGIQYFIFYIVLNLYPRLFDMIKF